MKLQSLPLVIVILLGVGAGLGLYSLYASNAISYASNDPKACMNCHVMGSHYASWFKSSHRNVATCNDCHVPNNNIVSKLLFKAKDGLYHSTVFTLGLEPQVIHARSESQEVIQSNCVNCHSHQIMKISLASEDSHSGARNCWECHRQVPHGRVRSISSAPLARLPILESIYPFSEKKK